jgi:hypothetical protein
MSAAADECESLQHARDVVVAQAVRRLDGDRRFHAGAQFACRHRQQAVGITW